MGRSTIIIGALLASTALASPALAQNAGTETQPNQRQELDDNNVNPATGQAVSYDTELSIGPDGPGGLRLIRGRGHGANQSNMSFLISGNPTTQLQVSAGLKTIIFDKIGSNYEPADGSGATLIQNSSTQWTLTLEDGTVVVYNKFNQDNLTARGTSVAYPTGETLTLAYNSATWCANLQCTGTVDATRLQGVASSLGFLLHYDYARDDPPELPGQGTNWKRLEAVQAINTTIDPCAPSAFTCTTTQSWPTVSYDTTGGVTDPTGNTWRYTVSATQFSVRRPGSASDNIIYNIDTTTQRVTSVQQDGSTWSYGWSLAGNLLTMTRTDPLTNVLTVVSDTTVGLPKTITNELGKVTSHVYNSKGLRTKTTFPENDYVQYSYDGRGNVTQVKRVAKPTTGLPDIITSATYPATCTNPKSCNSPLTTTDARGNVTDYSYNGDGTLATVTAPAPTVGGIRPQIRYTYANVSTPGGSISQLQSVSQCQTAASCTGTADETRTTYGWSNQLAVTSITQANGTGTLSAVTTITNDAVGNPSTIDGPLPGTGDTSMLRYDNMRRVVGEIAPDPE